MNTIEAAELAVPKQGVAALFTRKKDHRSKPPRLKDTCAWKHALDEAGRRLGEPEQVFRSPKNPEVWLDKTGYDRVVSFLNRCNIPFATRKGNIPAVIGKTDPVPERTIAWFVPRNGRHRRRFIMQGGEWKPHEYERE